MLGVPLPVLLIVVPPFPVFVAFGWLYERRARRARRGVPRARGAARVIALVAILAVTGATVGLGAYGVRFARTTSDLFVASRAVTPWWNAAAISGEYLSAASFLGHRRAADEARLAARCGCRSASPPATSRCCCSSPRRCGASAPTRSPTSPRRGCARRGCASSSAAIVLLIGGFYLVPQLKGAGLTLGEVVGTPYWVGVVAVGAVVALNVALGGMRGITYVQAFQYWVKTFAIALPACLLLLHLGGLPERAALFGHELPARAGGRPGGARSTRPVLATFPEAATVRVDGRPLARRRRRARCACRPGRVELPAGTAVPVAEGTDAQRGEDWARPVSDAGDASPLFVYSLLIATFLGTMGLPHILVRFYTNRDGPAARRTTVRVLGLLGLFYAVPGGLRRARAGARARALPDRRDRHGRAATARGGVAGARRRAARRARRGGRVRGVHVDRVGAARVARGHAVARLRPRRRARAGGRARRRFRVGGAGRDGRAGAARARRRASSTSPCSSAGRSRSPPRRSARCCCSGSGGSG